MGNFVSAYPTVDYIVTESKKMGSIYFVILILLGLLVLSLTNNVIRPAIVGVLPTTVSNENSELKTRQFLTDLIIVSALVVALVIVHLIIRNTKTPEMINTDALKNKMAVEVGGAIGKLGGRQVALPGTGEFAGRTVAETQFSGS